MNRFEQSLRDCVKGDVSFDAMTRGLYATDASNYQVMPVAVAVPRDEDDVCAAVRCAREHGVAVLPRGGGTSLAGQTVGASMVIDFSKYMNGILELNVDERWVRVQPGIVLDNLNAALAEHGLLFAPDPATSSRATIGGMMGNNSSGTKSIVYGITRDHVLETKVLLYDGTVIDFKELSPEEYDRRSRERVDRPREAEILFGLRALIEWNRDEIERRFPKVMRRVQGYNLDAFIHTEAWNLSKLMVGSEGTLGVTLETKLNLVPLPKYQALCTIHFAGLMEAIQAVGPILEHGPSAVEILDADVIVRARKNLNVAPQCGFIQGDPEAILIVEFFGDSNFEAEGKAKTLAEDIERQGRGYAWPVITEPDEKAKVWGVRKSGLGLLLGMKGDRKPLPFIEDATVPIDVLPEYVAQILEFCADRDVPVAMYAHASVGCIHVRPVLDLRQQTDIDNMAAIAEFAFGLVTQFAGSWSGEHGDGRCRSPFLERFFGPAIYECFRQVKHLFDPDGKMNPGTIIDPEPMDQNLRYGAGYEAPSPATEYHYREDGSFAAAVEMCTGVGACRQTLAGTMCPSYRATHDEEHSTRGRANALRLAMSGQLPDQGLASKRLYGVMALCLSCKSCKSECPSNVDVARLKSEFLQQYHGAHGVSRREKLVANAASYAPRIAGWKAPVVNRLQRTVAFRRVLETIAGFDRRRTLPDYTSKPFPRWFAQRADSTASEKPTVALFNDTYMNYHEPNVGVSAVELLESCGYHVVLANAGCCQRPAISHGFLRRAKTRGEQTLRNLDNLIQQGLKIVVCEPACCSALVDDLPDLIDDLELGARIRENVMPIDEFLATELRDGSLACRFTSPYSNVLIHGHCHEKALFGGTAMRYVLQHVEGLIVEEIDAGCCGMAGSFGYEKEHYDLSMQIGEDRLFPAIRNRADGAAVIACGFSCRHQIAHGADANPVHWVETLRGDRG